MNITFSAFPPQYLNKVVNEMREFILSETVVDNPYPYVSNIEIFGHNVHLSLKHSNISKMDTGCT